MSPIGMLSTPRCVFLTVAQFALGNCQIGGCTETKAFNFAASATHAAAVHTPPHLGTAEHRPLQLGGLLAPQSESSACREFRGLTRGRCLCHT